MINESLTIPYSMVAVEKNDRIVVCITTGNYNVNEMTFEAVPFVHFYENDRDMIFSSSKSFDTYNIDNVKFLMHTNVENKILKLQEVYIESQSESFDLNSIVFYNEGGSIIMCRVKGYQNMADKEIYLVLENVVSKMVYSLHPNIWCDKKLLSKNYKILIDDEA